MVRFRRWILALAVPALFAGLASAQITCSTNVSAVPSLRAEGYTEQIGDITLFCTGGNASVVGSQIPTVNITIFLNTAVTSRLFSTGPNISEALLIIDEPGSGAPSVVPGFGPEAPQNVCAFPLVGAGLPAPSGCQQFSSNVASLLPGNPLVAVATDTPNGTTPGKNVFQGVVSGTSVTFFGIPVLAPAVPGLSRIFRITNISANATTLSGALPAQVVASISVSGATALLISGGTPTVGFVQSGLSTSVSGATNLSQCQSVATRSVSTLTFTELFGTSFKTRVAAQSDILYAGQGLPAASGPGSQNTPGQIYNSESNFVLPVNGTQTAGITDFGTRLKATFNNLPAGVRLFVSVGNVIDNLTPVTPPAIPGGSAGNFTTQSYAQLVPGETSADGNAGVGGFFPAVPASGNIGNVPVAEIPVFNGSATAVWEVVNTNPASLNTVKFAVYATFTSNVAQNSPPPGAATVNLSLAPTPPVAFAAIDGAAASSSLATPRFISDQNPAGSLFNITACPPIGPANATSRVGIFGGGFWFLGTDTGAISQIVGFGSPTSTPVTGDWDGTGTAKIGVFDHGLWILANAAGGISKIIGFGSPAAIPVVGDWDGNGTTNIGVFDHGVWYLANDAGLIYKVFGFGSATAIPVVGDWDGTGTTKVGVFDHGLWILANGAGGIYKLIGFGGSTATPVVGDWDGTGTVKIGVFDHGLWFLANSTGGISKVIGFGLATSKPVIGDWDGNGTANIGIFDNGLWFLANDSGGIYKIIGFGSPTATPVVGRW